MSMGYRSPRRDIALCLMMARGRKYRCERPRHWLREGDIVVILEPPWSWVTGCAARGAHRLVGCSGIVLAVQTCAVGAAYYVRYREVVKGGTVRHAAGAWYYKAQLLKVSEDHTHYPYARPWYGGDAE